MIATFSPLNFKAPSALPIGTVASYPTGMASKTISPIALAMPRSTVASSTGLPTFSPPTVANFAGGNPFANQFAFASPNMNQVGDTSLFTDPALFTDINNAFPSTTGTRATALPTDATGLEGVLTSILASPRSLSALPDVADKQTSGNSPRKVSDADLAQLLASGEELNDADKEDKSNSASDKPPVSNTRLLNEIDSLKAMLEKTLANKPTEPTLVSASPSSSKIKEEVEEPATT